MELLLTTLAVAVGVVLKVVLDKAYLVWLRSKSTPASLAWMQTRRLFGPKTDDVVAEMALEVSTHVVFDKLATNLTQRFPQVFQEVAAQAAAALKETHAKAATDMQAYVAQQALALDDLVGVVTAQTTNALAQLEERVKGFAEAQSQFETSVRERNQIALDSLTSSTSALVRQAEEQVQKALDEVTVRAAGGIAQASTVMTADLSNFLKAVEGGAQSRVDALLEKTEITFTAAASSLQTQTVKLTSDVSHSVEKLGDAVEEDLKEFLGAVEDAATEEVVALVARTKKGFDEAANDIKEGAAKALAQMSQDVEKHTDDAHVILADHASMQSLTVSALTEKTAALVNELHSKSQGLGTVQAELKQFLDSVEGYTQDEVDALVNSTKAIFTQVIEDLKAHTSEAVALMTEHAREHAQAAVKLIDSHATAQSLTMAGLTGKASALVEDIQAQSQTILGKVAEEASAQAASVLAGVQHELVAQAQTVFATHEEHVKEEAEKLFAKLDERVAATQVDVQAKSEEVLANLHTQISERMPSPFLPIPDSESSA